MQFNFAPLQIPEVETILKGKIRSPARRHQNRRATFRRAAPAMRLKWTPKKEASAAVPLFLFSIALPAVKNSANFRANECHLKRPRNLFE